MFGSFHFILLAALILVSSFGFISNAEKVRDSSSGARNGLQMRKPISRLSNLLANLETATDHCVEEIQNLKRELLPLQQESNEIPFSGTIDASTASSYSTDYSKNGTNELIKSSDIANLLFVLQRQHNETNHRLLQLQIENTQLGLRLEQRLNESNNRLSELRSENDNLKRFINDTNNQLQQLRTENAAGPCYGKNLQKVITHDDFNSGPYYILKSLPDGIICTSRTNVSSPSGSFMVYKKTGSSMLFLGTESTNSMFISFSPFVNWRLKLEYGNGDGIHKCIEGVDSLPHRLWENWNDSGNGLSTNCFTFSWSSNQDGALINGWFTLNYRHGMSLWY